MENNNKMDNKVSIIIWPIHFVKWIAYAHNVFWGF